MAGLGGGPAAEVHLNEFIRLLKDFFGEPLAVEALVAFLLVGLLWYVVRSLKGVAARVSRRKALREFVSGVDSFFKGEFEEAQEALQKVLERDPENCEARILLGDAYRARGDLAEAHKHHYQVAEVFGRELPRNRRSLGWDLFEMGRCGEALPHLARAVDADPEDRETCELLLEANLSEGRLAEAVDLARRLAETARGAKEKDRARRRQARVHAEAGSEYLERGEVREGTQLLKSAVRLDESLVGPRLALVKSAYLNASSGAAEKELLLHLGEMTRLAEAGDVVFERPGARRVSDATRPPEALAESPAREAETEAARELEAGGERRALPAPDAAAGEAGVPATVGRGPLAAIGSGMPAPPLRLDAGSLVKKLLPREAAYLCSECGLPAKDYGDLCSGCGGLGTLVTLATSALTPVPGMKEVFDEIRENRAFVKALVKRAASGGEGAADRLVSLGERVVSAIFREILRVEDNGPLIEILSRLGPEAVPRILSGYRRASGFSTRRLMREGRKAFRSLDGLVVLALAGMGEPVVPVVEALVESGQRETRQVALDVLVRLGRADRIEALRLCVSTKEMLDRLNACPVELLGAFIDGAPEGGFLVSQVFTDRTFGGERALARGLERRGNREKLRGVLMDRGFSPGAYGELEAVWGEPGVGTLVTDIIRSYGHAAGDHLIHSSTNSALSEEVREKALRLLLNQGGEEIERVTDLLSEGDPQTERELLRVIRAFGNRAVPSLIRSYGKTGLLERVGLNRRRVQHRKVKLLRALEQIGTYEAVQGLRRLQEREGDGDLKRRIASVLDVLEGRSTP